MLWPFNAAILQMGALRHVAKGLAKVIEGACVRAAHADSLVHMQDATHASHFIPYYRGSVQVQLAGFSLPPRLLSGSEPRELHPLRMLVWENQMEVFVD